MRRGGEGHSADVSGRGPGHAAYLCLERGVARSSRGFGLRDDEELTLVDKIEHGGKPVEAAWALGDAVVSMREDDRVADVVQRVEP